MKNPEAPINFKRCKLMHEGFQKMDGKKLVDHNWNR